MRSSASAPKFKLPGDTQEMENLFMLAGHCSPLDSGLRAVQFASFVSVRSTSAARAVAQPSVRGDQQRDHGRTTSTSLSGRRPALHTDDKR